MFEKLILIRHGSLPSEYANMFIGINEIELSETGRRDAEAVGRWLAGQSYDHVLSGSLQRVCQTRAVLNELKQTDKKRIVVFSNGGVLMSLLADIVGLPRKNAFHLWLERGGVAEIRVKPDGPMQLTSIFRPAGFLTGSV